jgi:hypothetical protein
LDIQHRNEEPFTRNGEPAIIDTIAIAREHDIGLHAVSNPHEPTVPSNGTMILQG